MFFRQLLNHKWGLFLHPRTWWFCLLALSGFNRVQSGPFKGLRYVRKSVGSNWAPKILGTYELELHPCFNKLCRQPWELLIDVGAAEGYYAVGLALTTQTTVIAFEQEERGRDLILKMAILNKVADKLSIHGHCSPETLINSLGENKRTLVVMDVEGYETTLLNESVIPHLGESTVLVEIHEGATREVTRLLNARFEKTHRITEFETRPRTFSDFLAPWWIRHLAARPIWIQAAMNESREGPMTWLLFEPQQPGSR